MDNNVFFTELESLLKKMEFQTTMLKVEDPRIGESLRALVPVDEAGNSVLLEVMVIPYDEDALLIQIYTTLLTEIGPGYEALKEMLLEWNLTCPIGAFGIYRQEKQFYHKYNYLMPTDEDPKQMAMEIFYIIHLVMDVIAGLFPDVVRLSGNI